MSVDVAYRAASRAGPQASYRAGARLQGFSLCKRNQRALGYEYHDRIVFSNAWQSLAIELWYTTIPTIRLPNFVIPQYHNTKLEYHKLWYYKRRGIPLVLQGAGGI